MEALWPGCWPALGPSRAKKTAEIPATSPELEPLIHQLEDLHLEMQNLVKENSAALAQVHPDNEASAHNLLHYVALRRHDFRALQEQLATLGLSSLGRTESHVLGGIRAVLRILYQLQTGKPRRFPGRWKGCDRACGRRLLRHNTQVLLGPEPEGRKVRIMVTMPSEAATCYELVRDLLRDGMNCMRINCAHDGEESWSAMIRNLRTAELETGKSCKVEMDLAGPKLRTGPIEPGPAVVKFRPRRDSFGRIERAARIWLTPSAHPELPPTPADASIPMAARWLAPLKPGDSVQFTDTRGAERTLTITAAAGKSRWAECRQTAYVVSGMLLTAEAQGTPRLRRPGRVGKIPPKPQTILLRAGDALVLTRSLEPGRPARFNQQHELLSPARIGVTLPEFFDSVEAGQPIWLDDGKLGGVIASVGPNEVTVEIQKARSGGERLGAEKGINLPETNLRIASLTAEDIRILPFAAKNSDMLGYSFVRTEADVRLLQSHLNELGAKELGILLKIETREAFDNLPSLLLAALASRNSGVMIARGDLAIECGYQRMAEVQEEILWISEAAHVPVVWATQVLETLAKTGTPSRSEITDAAMGERAECVMLNKGPYALRAARTLDDILRRMEAHQEKKGSLLRRLGVATGFESGLER